MLSQGYIFYKRLIPLLQARELNNSRLFLTPPIGELSAFPDYLLTTLQSLYPSMAKSTLVLVGHGTPKDIANKRSVNKVADIIKQSSFFIQVHTFYLAEEPFMRTIPLIFKDTPVLVVPLFFSDGDHCEEVAALSLAGSNIHVTPPVCHLIDSTLMIDKAANQAMPLSFFTKEG
jgi:hypothetical protein